MNGNTEKSKFPYVQVNGVPAGTRNELTSF